MESYQIDGIKPFKNYHRVFEINNILISDDLYERKFLCDLNSCKGACCVEGDGGAPLEKEEIKEIENSFNYVKKYLPKKNLNEIKKQGFFIVGDDGGFETPLVNGRECAFSIKDERGIIKCGLNHSKNETTISKCDFIVEFGFFS